MADLQTIELLNSYSAILIYREVLYFIFLLVDPRKSVAVEADGALPPLYEGLHTINISAVYLKLHLLPTL